MKYKYYIVTFNPIDYNIRIKGTNKLSEYSVFYNIFLMKREYINNKICWFMYDDTIWKSCSGGNIKNLENEYQIFNREQKLKRILNES